MKYLWAVLSGFVVGLAAGGALVFVNPLTGEAESELPAFDRVLSYAWPADAVVMTHGGRVPLDRKPKSVPELWETTVRKTALAAFVLGGGEPQAVGSRIAVPSERTDLLSRGVIVDDYWLLTVPGEGSLYLVAASNVWPLAKDTLLPVSLLGRPWGGPRSYVLTTGPGIAETALVYGATGRFAAREGSAAERIRVARFSRSGGFEEVAAELHLRVLDAPAGEEQNAAAGAAEGAPSAGGQ